MTPTNLILWIHVLCGAGWVGACIIFVLASTALDAQQPELREFLDRVTPRTNRIGIVCALVIPFTGMVNFAFAARKHNYRLPASFNLIIAAKVLLLTAMVMMLILASKIHRLRTREPKSEVRQLALAYGVIASCGALALILGLWLSGL